MRRIAGGISDMTLWRWLKRGILPSPLVIERRRYWWREAILDSLQCAGRSDARPVSPHATYGETEHAKDHP
ncbi:helix-turn-helix transcriptional regulator [Thiorhodovibrio frisius]|uniref:helix-turn-helix transcriptional regulator n=1 Tax=Thiorhodovibrio frisius TaxID=631362 RepID=UPI000255EE85|nr:hypothetical protein [Thiorhodovibrio frisius]